MLQIFPKIVLALYLISLASKVSGQNAVAADVGYSLSNNPNDVHFYFYPVNGNLDNPQEIIFNNTESLTNSGFNYSAVKTVLLIHGFTADRSVSLDAEVIPAYLSSNLNYNYIVVDWGALSGNAAFANLAQEYVIYSEVVNTSIPIVAQRTTDFIKFLGVNPSQIHIVGHSLGAHTSGRVGYYYQTQTNGAKLARITGLDPAGPNFFLGIVYRKIQKTDAQFVDILHSNAGLLGDFTVDGHVDFYVNGGVNQPNCSLYSDANACSHEFANILYAASINNTFLGCECLNTNAVTGLVGLIGIQTQSILNGTLLCLANCGLSGVRFGEFCPNTSRGLYSVTAGNPP